MSIVIAQVPTEIVVDPRRYMTMIHGIAGVGKTTWAKQIDGHYFLQTEIGTEGVSVFANPVLDWGEFNESCKKIIEQKARGWKDEEDKPVREIKTLVVDRFELLYDYCGTYLCETTTFPEGGVQLKFDRVEDVPWGKGYNRANRLMIASLNKLMLLGFGIVLICQTNERPVKWRGQDMQKHEPMLPPKACKEIVATCGAVGHFVIEQVTKKNAEGQVYVEKEDRWSFWQPTFLRVAKHRLVHFPERVALNRMTMYDDYLEEFQKALVLGEEEKRAKEGGENDLT